MKLNKLFSKAILLVLCVILCISGAACSRSNDSDTEKGDIPEAVGTVNDQTVSTATNTLHKRNITESNRTFVANAGSQNASTDYTIVADSASSYAMTAASFIATHLFSASNATFKVVSGDGSNITLNDQAKYIILGCKNLFAETGLTMPDDELGAGGYYIKSYKNSVFLEVEERNGYQMGAIAFLNIVVGYDMITEDTVIYERVADTLPDLDVIERPDFEWCNYTNNMTNTTKYGMGYATEYMFMLVGKNQKGVHNIESFLPRTEWFDKYPEWYSDKMMSGYLQLCYTARGDEEKLELMLDTAFEVMKETVDANPNSNIITFTAEDTPHGCECDECTDVVKKDGALSATIIRFMNRMDDRLQEYLTAQAEATNTKKRTVHIAFFAYHVALAPPTTTVEEDPSLKANPDVAVFIAPISANYTKTFYDQENSVYAQNIKDWSNYVDNIIAWMYECNYNNYLYPYNTYSSMIENYRFMKENGTLVMYNEGQRNNQNVTCFGKLKEYLDSKAQFDVNISYNYYVDKFFTHYFDDAADNMREYYEQMIAWETYIESIPENGLGGGIYQNISKTEFWPKRMVDGWLELMDEAYLAVEHYKDTDPIKYAKLVKHIKIETISPKYMRCTLYGASYTESELLDLRISFKADCDELGVVEHMEHYFITDVFKSWGLE